MNVQQCMTKQVYSCRPDTNLSDAARLMWEHDFGVLPVLGAQDRVLGVVTDRDLCMGAYTRGKGLRDLSVNDSMSRKVSACAPSDSLERALRTMADQRVRRLPVVDEQGKLVGILSMNDVVRRIAGLTDAQERARLSSSALETLAAVCQPRATGFEESKTIPAAPRERMAAAPGKR